MSIVKATKKNSSNILKNVCTTTKNKTKQQQQKTQYN